MSNLCLKERRLLLHVAKLPCTKAVPAYSHGGQAGLPSTFPYAPASLVHVLKPAATALPGLHRCLITFRCLKGLFKTQGKLTPEVLEWLLVRWPLRQLCPKKV